jgi:hypothetical protein
MDFSGKYKGTLWYGEGYALSSPNNELSFQMQIEEKDNWFTGIATDIDGVGMSVDEAKVEGIINGIHIEFDKTYKRNHYDDGNGNTIYENQEGFPIYYEGTYNDETGYYEGSWKYNVVRRFLFFFTKPVSIGSGTFRLKKVEIE